MTDAEERAYEQGRKSFARQLLVMAVQELGLHGEKLRAERLLIERAETVAMLRQICDEHGDNDWNDDLHLADVIEKHLWRHLETE